jgi:hypothetical protein
VTLNLRPNPCRRVATSANVRCPTRSAWKNARTSSSMAAASLRSWLKERQSTISSSKRSRSWYAAYEMSSIDASSPGSLPLCARARARRRAWPGSMRSAGSMVSF